MVFFRVLCISRLQFVNNCSCLVTYKFGISGGLKQFLQVKLPAEVINANSVWLYCECIIMIVCKHFQFFMFLLLFSVYQIIPLH